MSQKSAFVQAMDMTNHRTIGENGAVEFSARGVQGSRVALFFALVRGCSDSRVKELMHLVMEDANKDQPDVIADLFLMAFQTRNCRGGKGERDLFNTMIMEMATVYPDTTRDLVHLIPQYGSFKDWFKLIHLVTANETSAKTRLAMKPIVETILDFVKYQLLQDMKALDRMKESSSLDVGGKGGKGPSLLAKWAPREKKRFHSQVQMIARKLFPQSQAPKKDYRKLISRLNASINTPEILMSAKKWDTIDFSQVPSLSLLRHRKAFLNEKVGSAPPSSDDLETGNRHPSDASRVECRKMLRDMMVKQKNEPEKNKLHGKQLYPHDIVKKIWNGSCRLSELEEDVLSCQWQDIKNSVIGAMEAVRENKGMEVDGEGDRESNSVDLGQIVSLVDVSGSMYGTPIEVAISLGILTSELASPAFANRCLTFSHKPQWVEFGTGMTLVEKVGVLRRAEWGMNTDFEAAMDKILDIAVKAKLEPCEIPDLIVFSDMQFDEARGATAMGWETHHLTARGWETHHQTARGWETHHQCIVRRFKEEGIKVCGKPWPAPKMIYWNLRGDTRGFPATANTPNVTMLSGFSPSLMKLLLDGEKVETNPFDSLRKALDDEIYDKVRMVLSRSKEGLLEYYKAPDKVARDTPAGEEVKEEDTWEMVK